MRKKKDVSIPATGPTPLDEIRQAEARAASQLIQAQQEARARKQAARKQASQLEQQARLDGAQAGQADCENKVSEARRQAEGVIADAEAQAALLASQGQELVQDAVLWSIRVVTGVDGKEGRHEP